MVNHLLKLRLVCYNKIKDGNALSDIVLVQIPLDAKENLEIIPPDHKFLGWFVDEDPFNIGAGYNLCLFLSPDGTVSTSYHRP